MKKEIYKKEIWRINDKELLNLIVGRDGGKTTIKIIDKILKEPYNTNQLAKTLKLDYNTITHHINIIYNHNYILKLKFENTYFYHPSDKLIKSLDEYYIIKEYMKQE
ncbi:winged helix-turn-helix domain-containing protein [Methanobrevibacter sp.]|uniref:winged helix-turn-helix domain-containing protein n=1 Tax=Methanobrevibacter sp. TaxID=66852 RepID=UPI003890277B